MQDALNSVRVMKRSGISVLIVEQHALSVLDVTDRAYVLDKGRIVFNGPSAELRSDAGPAPPTAGGMRMGAPLLEIDRLDQGL